jgi:hypothetical protein
MLLIFTRLSQHDTTITRGRCPSSTSLRYQDLFSANIVAFHP